MTTRDELIALAKVVAQKNAIATCFAMRNAYGLTPEQRADMDAEAKVFRDELALAESAYQNALHSYSPPTLLPPQSEPDADNEKDRRQNRDEQG